MPTGLMTGFDRSPRSASADQQAEDVVRTLFGIEQAAFVDACLGCEPLVTHGPVRRFNGLLGRALILTQRALMKLMPD